MFKYYLTDSIFPFLPLSSSNISSANKKITARFFVILKKENIERENPYAN